MNTEFVRYLELLSEMYPTIDAASTEIINLQSILNLPKGTEHFLSDIHGEYASFSHVLRNGSGAVRKKIDDVFGHTLSKQDKCSLASLIYYPREKIDFVKRQGADMKKQCPALYMDGSTVKGVVRRRGMLHGTEFAVSK